MAYATSAQLASLGLPSAILAEMPSGSITDCLDAASSMVDDALRTAGYSVPLTTWTYAITQLVCHLASFDLLIAHGYNTASTDSLVADRYKAATTRLRDVASGKLRLVDQTMDASPSLDEREPLMASKAVVDWFGGGSSDSWESSV
jgi:phage gp36-like protein